MNKNSANVITLKARKCPICGRASVETYHAFCSKRCADIDLGHWLNGNYRIPLSLTELDDDEFDDL